ncbi:MAG: hypothetical protein LBT65_02065 [Synergistaceae bacterium]|jgi:hypothetical protein|nr:hypothetical protein [Synergistaceae bacterium]
MQTKRVAENIGGRAGKSPGGRGRKFSGEGALWRGFLASLVFVSALLSPTRAVAAVDAAAWTWDVLVVPPDEGWESEPGLSIRKTLLWFQNEVSEVGDGILGHDLNFVFLPPLTEDSVSSYSLPLTRGTVSVFSFASSFVDAGLIDRMRTSGVPLMLAGGENVFFYEGGRLLPFVYALDLFRDYRCRAFTEYAALTQDPSARIGVIGARFTLNEEREAKICTALLTDAKFMPMPYWVDPSVSDTFSILTEEVKEYSAGVFISYVGRMASAEIWRGLMEARSPYRLWYGGAPDSSFLSFRRMLFADQNMNLDTQGGFEQLKRDLWSSRTVGVADSVAAGRANALAVWLNRALSALETGDPLDRRGLLLTLARAQGIPFGAQTLDIDETTHRPARRHVRVFEIRDRSFFVLKDMDVTGLGYYDY